MHRAALLRTRILLALLAMGASGCASPQSASEQCTLPPPPAGLAQGFGEGPTYPTAKSAALGSLCQSIRSEVTSIVTTRQGFRLSDKESSYEDAAETLSTGKAHCVFDGVDVQETRRDLSDGRSCVAVQVDPAAYLKYLNGRRCTVDFVLSFSCGPDNPLLPVVVADLRQRAFVPVHDVAGAPYAAVVNVDLTFHPAGVGALLVADGEVRYTVTARQSGEIVHTFRTQKIVVHGFSQDRLAADFLQAAVKELEQVPSTDQGRP